MNRDEAINLLREHARQHKPSYYSEPFEPHEWVIQAVMAATSSRVLTCVYCGRWYPQETPASGDAILTEHIRVCEKHPLREAEAKIVKARAALAGLVGESDPDNLRALELSIRALPAPDADKAAMVNAIHALLDLPSVQEPCHG